VTSRPIPRCWAGSDASRAAKLGRRNISLQWTETVLEAYTRGMRVAVYGLWHLGCVTAACLAEAGHAVVGLDLDAAVVEGLQRGRPPLEEPGLAELAAAGLRSGRLSFTTHPENALADARVLWVTFDTPVDEQDLADVGFVRSRLEAVADAVRSGTLVLISSQVPVGFTEALAHDWQVRGIQCAYSPENLRLGEALERFQRPERVVLGIRNEADRAVLTDLFQPLGARIEWVTVESAEMIKHALNAFLATSVAFINEVGRLCEVSGADAKEVERGLRSDGRVGARAYLTPGAAFAGGTLARDVRLLRQLGARSGIGTPLLDGVWASNAEQQAWVLRTLERLAGPLSQSVVAVLGLTYKPGTSTLRRSAAIEACAWLSQRGFGVQAHDPTVTAAGPELPPAVRLCSSPQEALAGADVALVATPWPDYRALQADEVVGLMRRPQIVDTGRFLAETLGRDARITYVAVGAKGP